MRKVDKSFKKVAKSKKRKKNASGKMQALEKDHRSASLEFKVCCKNIRSPFVAKIGWKRYPDHSKEMLNIDPKNTASEPFFAEFNRKPTVKWWLCQIQLLVRQDLSSSAPLQSEGVG